MKGPLQIILLLIVLSGLTAAGFWAGRAFIQVKPPDVMVEDIKASVHDLVQPPPAETETGPYAVFPSIGVMTRSVAIEKLKARDGHLTALLPVEKAAEIQAGQNAVFFNRKDGAIRAETATVASVSPAEDSVEIVFDAPDALTLNAPRLHGRVIVYENAMAKRIPLAALHRDAEGVPYAWKAEPQAQTGQYRAVRQPVFEGQQGDGYAEIGPEIGNAELVLVNAGDTVEDGALLTAALREPDAPLHGLMQQAENRAKEETSALYQKELNQFRETTGTADCANVDDQGVPLYLNGQSNWALGPEDFGGVSPYPLAPQPPSPPVPSGQGCGAGGEAAALFPELQAGENTAAPQPAPQPASAGGCGGCGNTGGAPVYGGPAPAAP